MKKGESLTDNTKREIALVLGDDTHMYHWYIKNHAIYTLPSGFIISIEKENIKTEFCFGYNDYHDISNDDAYRMADFAKTNEQYFIEQNTKKLREKIEALETSDENSIYAIREFDKSRSLIRVGINIQSVSGERFRVSKEDLEVIISAYKNELRNLEKRLCSYLKRYGLSKVKTSVYWSGE